MGPGIFHTGSREQRLQRLRVATSSQNYPLKSEGGVLVLFIPCPYFRLKDSHIELLLVKSNT